MRRGFDPNVVSGAETIHSLIVAFWRLAAVTTAWLIGSMVARSE
jgi:hypothetical protein